LIWEGWGNHSTMRKPLTCMLKCKALTILSHTCIKYTLPCARIKHPVLYVMGIDIAIYVEINLTTIRSWSLPADHYHVQMIVIMASQSGLWPADHDHSQPILIMTSWSWLWPADLDYGQLILIMASWSWLWPADFDYGQLILIMASWSWSRPTNLEQCWPWLLFIRVIA
jgi:hypothetical protein